MGTIAGENDYSFVGSPIGNLDLWNSISDTQVNPNGTQFIFSDSYANKIRKIDFSTGLFPYNKFYFHSMEIKIINKISLSIKNNKQFFYWEKNIKHKDSISTIAGSGSNGNQNGNILIASFNNTNSIAIDWINSPEIIYVADSGNYCIRRISQTSSLVSTFAGNCSQAGYQNGPLLSASFYNPNSIRYLSSSSGTKLLIADKGNNVIRMIDISLGIFFA